MNEQNHTATISNRSDFALWAVERAQAIVAEQGAALAMAARDGKEDDVRATGTALGSAITNAMLEVFDALLDDA